MPRLKRSVLVCGLATFGLISAVTNLQMFMLRGRQASQCKPESCESLTEGSGRCKIHVQRLMSSAASNSSNLPDSTQHQIAESSIAIDRDIVIKNQEAGLVDASGIVEEETLSAAGSSNGIDPDNPLYKWALEHKVGKEREREREREKRRATILFD
jgi:hypothetical protein